MSAGELKYEFRQLYEEYFPMVKSLCLGYVKGEKEQAMDLTQEVFIKVWNALPGFRKESSYKTWIYRIAVNTCLLYLRDNKKKDHSSLEKHVAIPAGEDKHTTDFEELYLAIGQLAELDRIIIMLVLDEVKYDEIANLVGITEGNLRVKIHRIKQKLNELMNHG